MLILKKMQGMFQNLREPTSNPIWIILKTTLIMGRYNLKGVTAKSGDAFFLLEMNVLYRF